MPLLIATANPAKAREFRQMLAAGDGGGGGGGGAEMGKDKFLDLAAFPDAKCVEETGQTFLQNACLKAVGYAKQIAADWTLADDSGLEVDAFGGAPGVYSARWALRRGIIASTGDADADNNATLLKELADVPDDRRSGRFVCVLALADVRGQVIATVRRTIEGRVLREPRGSNGFGYDPLFFVPELGKTTAELLPADKHRISHRGRALAALSELIAERGLADLLGMACENADPVH